MDVQDLGKDADEAYHQAYGKPGSEAQKEEDPLAEMLKDESEDTVDSGGGEQENDQPEPQEKPDDIEQKLKASEGRRKVELERMNQLLSSALQEKERLAAELAARKPSPAVDEPELALAPGEEDLAFFKTQYPNVFKGVQALLKKKEQDFSRGVDAVTNVAANIQQEKYITELDSKFPKWREIKESPDFAKWLEVTDRYTGTQRYQLLVAADSRRDHNVVKNLYEDFARESGLLSDAGEPSQSAPSPQKRNANMSPSTAGNPTPSSSTQKGFITRQEIDKLYESRMKGQYTDDEFAKIEARVFKLVREGKVR
jgi:hypothetical protein